MLGVRTKGDPLRFAGPVRGVVLAIDRDEPISSVKTMDDLLEESEGRRRLSMILLELFPVAVVGVSLLFLLVASVASVLQAAQAARIDPMAALRLG